MKAKHTVCLDCYLPINTDNIKKNEYNALKRSIVGSSTLKVDFCQVCNKCMIVPHDKFSAVCFECKGIISTDEYKSWRSSVLKRDDKTCQECNSTKNLEAHHIKSWKNFPELRYNIDNGIILCSECHYKTLSYGKGNLTRDQEL